MPRVEKSKSLKLCRYSDREEFFHVITHGVAFVLTIISALFLFYYSSSNPLGQLLGILVFVFSMAGVFLSSTLYHLSREVKIRSCLQKVDHMCIYLLIAGTNTPIAIRYLDSFYVFFYLVLIWLVALSGIIAKLYYYSFFERYDLGYYVAMGLLGGGLVLFVYHRMSVGVLCGLVLGGLSYLIGVFFYRKKQMPYHHVIWHLWVIGGGAFHYWAVWLTML